MGVLDDFRKQKERVIEQLGVDISDVLLVFFAGQALEGFCANPKINTEGRYEETFYAEVTRWSYNLAKAMVKKHEQIIKETTNGEAERERQE